MKMGWGVGGETCVCIVQKTTRTEIGEDGVGGGGWRVKRVSV